MPLKKKSHMPDSPLQAPYSLRGSDSGKVVTAREAVSLIRDGDTIATSGFVGIGFPENIAVALEALFAPGLAFAHGIPWDPWIINADGSGLHRVAETAGDEPSVVWSPDPDKAQLFVYSGVGSAIVDVASGAVSPLKFVQGYGPVVWLNT